MRPDPPIGSIIWGKKFSLKDRTPQFVLLLFLVFAALLLMFGVIKDNEKEANPIERMGEKPIRKYIQP